MRSSQSRVGLTLSIVGVCVAGIALLGTASRNTALPTLAIESPEPGRVAAASPQTAEAAARAWFDALQRDRPDLLWEALPASYQRDANDLLHNFAARMPPRVWDRSVRLAEAVVRERKKFLTSSQTSRGTATEGRDDSGDPLLEIDEIGLLELLLSMDITDLQSLKTADIANLLRDPGLRIATRCHPAWTFLGSLFLLPPVDVRERRARESTDHFVTVREEVQEIGLVETEFVEVEGMWIPGALRKFWIETIGPALAAARESSSPLLTDKEADELLRAMDEVQGQLSELARTSASDVIQLVLMSVAYLVVEPPKIVADFEVHTGKSLVGGDKTVLVYCSVPTPVKGDDAAINFELAQELSRQLDANSIRVTDADRVRAWLEQNGDWQQVWKIGAAFGVDYVLCVDLKEFTLLAEWNRDLFLGRAEGAVGIVEMKKDKQGGDSIYTKEVSSQFPIGAAVPAHRLSYVDFKQLYLTMLAGQIGRLFHESSAEDHLPDAVP